MSERKKKLKSRHCMTAAICGEEGTAAVELLVRASKAFEDLKIFQAADW